MLWIKVTTKMASFLLRILKENRQEKELFVLQQATLKEGEMWRIKHARHRQLDRGERETKNKSYHLYPKFLS